MFVCSIKATTLRFLSVLLLSGITLVGVTAFAAGAQKDTPSSTESVSVSYEGVKTESDRRAFLSSFGYEVAEEGVSEASFTLPKTLDAALLGYNELQKAQGLDLEKYTGKRVTRYTYLLKNYGDYDGKVYANVIVYRNRVIAADLTGVGEKSFVRALGTLPTA